MAARDWSDEWEDSESGGTPCACGRGCAEADYAGNPQMGPRAFCSTDTHHIGAVIRGMPAMYVELRLKLAKTGQQEERVSGSREAPTPLDLKVEAFMRHIILVAVSWEEQVRAAASLSPVPDGPVRDGTSLARACRLLAGEDNERTGYLGTLLMLEPEDKNRPVKGSTTLNELEPGSMVRIDSAGDAWQKREMGGADAGLEFLKLHGRARGMLGLSLQRRRVKVLCDGCDAPTLVQREALGGGWEPVVRCTACPQTYIGNEFELIIGREYAASQQAARASLPGGKQARHARLCDFGGSCWPKPGGHDKMPSKETCARSPGVVDAPQARHGAVRPRHPRRVRRFRRRYPDGRGQLGAPGAEDHRP